ncbi:hypothetical protein NCC49_001375 [Naganishia albida]|nr:hypothetical protein NCC49_001375 [Naganishia albida]
MITMETVPFPQGLVRVQPLATAPLNDTPSSSHYRTRPQETRKRSDSALTPSRTRPRQLKRYETGPQRLHHGSEVKQRDDRSIGSASTIESDTRPTTTEFPSYESFQQLRDSKSSRLDAGRGERPQRRPYQGRQHSSDSSDQQDFAGNGEAYARRPILDRPRPRSTHFVEFDDAQSSFQRRHDADNRLRRQSTRRSLELGRFRLHEKEDEAVSYLQDVGHGRGQPPMTAELQDSNIRLREGGIQRGGAMIMRRGSEMITRSRDDVIEAKVVLLGSQCVGKTSLAKRYTEGSFTAQSATVNASLFTRKSVHDGVAVRLQIWDTCGEEKHRSLTKLYYRGAHVALILYDITDLQSFEDVRGWIHELRTVSEETVIFVVGAKYDLSKAGKRKVDRRYARWKLATWLGVDTGENLGHLGAQIANRPRPDALQRPGQATPIGERFRAFEFPSTPAATGIDPPVSPSPLSPEPIRTSRPGAYRFLSLLNISGGKSSNSALLDDDESDALTSSITLQPASRAQSGKRSNSTSAATALMSMPLASSTPRSTPTHRVQVSVTTSGLNLIAATPVAPRRKSEDWSMNKAKDEFLRALGGTNPQESEATRALKRTSGELLRPYSANPDLNQGNVGGEAIEYAVDDDSGWGKLIVGTNVRIGETSSKTGQGVNEVFASLTAQLVARQQQIRLEQARRAREIIDISSHEQTAKASNNKSKGKATCCT